MAVEKLSAKVAKKASNGKGFMLEGQDGWFNASNEAAPTLANVAVGTLVDIEYFKKGVSKIVTKITTAGAAKTSTPAVAEAAPNDGKKRCKCGAVIKNERFNSCYACSQAKKDTAEAVPPAAAKETGTYVGGSKYGSAEDIAGKEVGCAANCAATILSGSQNDPETILEMFRTLFNGILEHIKANK